MKVLHFSTGKQWRGGEQQILFTVELLSNNVTSTVVCQPGSPMSEQLLKKNLTSVHLSVRNSVDILAMWRFYRLIKKTRPALIHLHDAKAHSIAVFSSWIFRWKVPMILTRRVLFNMRSNLLNRWKYNYPSIQQIICVSEAIREKVTRIPVDEFKTKTIHSGIKVLPISEGKKKSARRELTKRFNLKETDYFVGNVAALTSEKGLDTFIKSALAAREKDSQITFLSFGKGPLREELQRQIDHLGLGDIVYLTGFQSDIRDLVPGLDLLVSTSTVEGLGTNLLDGLMAQVPIVAAQVGGIPEIIQNGHNGVLVEVANHQQLAERILFLKANPEVAKSYTAHGLETLRLFDINRNVAKIEQVYIDCL